MNANILVRGLWGDEAWTAIISRLSLPEIIQTTGADFHPPLYYLLVHFWTNIFGSSEIALRSLSLLFYCLTFPVIYFFAKKITKSTAYSLFSALTVLFNPILFLYAFEARNYTLFLFLSTLSMYAFAHLTGILFNPKRQTPNLKHQISNRPVRWRFRILNFGISGVAYVVSTLAGLYTHYYFFFILAAQGLYILLFSKNLLKQFIVFWLFIVLYYLPWLPVFFSQSSTVTHNYWIGRLNSRTHIEALIRLIAGERPTPFSTPLLILFTLLTLTTTKLALAATDRAKSAAANRFNSIFSLLILWLLVPILIPTIISFYRPIFFYRYLIPQAAPLFLGFSFLSFFAFQNKRFSTLLISLILSLSLGINFQAFTQQTNPLARGSLNQIYSQIQENDLILTVLPSFAEVIYYNRQISQKTNQPQLPVFVSPEGLNQASGKALLDTLVRRGELAVSEPPQNQRYFLVTPGPDLKLIQP